MDAAVAAAEAAQAAPGSTTLTPTSAGARGGDRQTEGPCSHGGVLTDEEFAAEKARILAT